MSSCHSQTPQPAIRAPSAQSAAQNQPRATPTNNTGHTHCPSPDRLSDTVPGRRCDRRKAAELSRSGLPSGKPGGACTRPLRLGPCVPSRRKRPGSTFVMLQGRCKRREESEVGCGRVAGLEVRTAAGHGLHCLHSGINFPDSSDHHSTASPSMQPAPSPGAGIRARLRRRHQRRHAAGRSFAVQVHHDAPQRLRI